MRMRKSAFHFSAAFLKNRGRACSGSSDLLGSKFRQFARTCTRTCWPQHVLSDHDKSLFMYFIPIVEGEPSPQLAGQRIHVHLFFAALLARGERHAQLRRGTEPLQKANSKAQSIGTMGVGFSDCVIRQSWAAESSDKKRQMVLSSKPVPA